LTGYKLLANSMPVPLTAGFAVSDRPQPHAPPFLTDMPELQLVAFCHHQGLCVLSGK
jgi:hypothetical protein